MTETVSVHQVLDRISRQAERHTADLRVITDIPVDYFVRQGDIYVTRVKDGTFDIGGDTKPNVQVALGTSKGSRHVAHDVLADIRPMRDANSLEGPRIKALKPWRITHPEHADYELPAGEYRVTYQLDAKTMRRVAD